MKITNLLNELYSNAKIVMIVNDQPSSPLQIRNVLWQGCTAETKLFNFVTDHVLSIILLPVKPFGTHFGERGLLDLLFVTNGALI